MDAGEGRHTAGRDENLDREHAAEKWPRAADADARKASGQPAKFIPHCTSVGARLRTVASRPPVLR
jgi:hypothetical protein